MTRPWPQLRPCVLTHSFSGVSRTHQAHRPVRLLRCQQRSCSSRKRQLLTLAIESSCDDTCVAVLQKSPATGTAHLHFNKKVTSDNRDFRGVNPGTAVESHTRHLAPLIQEALHALPEVNANEVGDGAADSNRPLWVDGRCRRKPDFVAVTRGPGMTSNLATGLNTAKGLAAAWGIPLLAVNHMQAHALTPRLVSALKKEQTDVNAQTAPASGGHGTNYEPAFPFLSLLVSGGHTLLVHSHSLVDHEILASAMNIAIGNMIDKCARLIIPEELMAGVESVMYGPLLESFAFPNITTTADYGYTPPRRRVDEIQNFDSGLGWVLRPPLAGTTAMAFDFSGFNSQVQTAVEERPGMDIDERRILARHTMRLAFEHLASRLLFALRATNHSDSVEDKQVKTIVVAGGVASNKYLMYILRSMLKVRGFGDLHILAPPPAFCTDNAAMIAWTGMEMYEAGWRSTMDVRPKRKWPVDPRIEGGILGAGGWIKNSNQDLYNM